MRSDNRAVSKPNAAEEAQQAAREAGDTGPRHPGGHWRLPMWDLTLAVLLTCVLIGLTHLPPDAQPPDAQPPAPIATKTVTLAIHRDIEALLDSYMPFLRADTPLLQRPEHTEGQAADDAESWVLPTTERKASPACDQLLYHRNSCQPSLKAACRRLMHNLTFAAEGHERVAKSLAGPRTEGLWLSRVEGPLRGLVWSLDDMNVPRHLTVGAGEPLRATASADEVVDHDTGQETAWLVWSYLGRQMSPGMSANSFIRPPLLSLREKCASIVADIRLLSDPDAPDGACTWAELSPLAGPVGQLVSAVDDDLAALDAADKILLGLERWLERMLDGHFDVDEVVDGTVVRTRFKLPPPAVISRAVAARLDRMRDDASALQQGWIAPKLFVGQQD